MMKNTGIKLLFLAFLVSISFLSNAQCKQFTKKYCLPSIEPFTYNGQLNSAVLNEGDIAELLLTFYSGQSYRIMVCNQETLGTLQFRLLDTERNLIFDNKEYDSVSFWDFKANSTQQLIVQVIVPEMEKRVDMVASGCVSILVGFMEDVGDED
jgi:hypothetical protein